MPLQEGDLEHYPRKFGKYHLLGPLAQGGMGALYLAVAGDRGLERLMVIKTVLPHLADAEYVARFRDEAKVVVKLSHGNLIPVFDAGLVAGELFLAMDFVEGRDLRAVWNRCAKKQVAFPIDVAVYIVKELCRGLGYAHAFPDLKLVHRDVSPPNILVSYTGEVKLTDFGLASSTLKLEKTAPGIIYGKVAYMSPEQARGEKLDGRSDMYAAGIVLWELLTGRQLFPPGKDQPQDLLARAKNPEVMRPSKRAPRVPTDLDEICLKALAPERPDRYIDCDEMRMALQTWLAHNAPTTDGTRMSAFLQELFSEDIVRERTERAEMIQRVRTRALTLPPTDELRIMVEKSDKAILPAEAYLAATGEPPVRKPGSVGRRAADADTDADDRRQQPDRRASKAAVVGEHPPQPQGAAALAARAQSEEEDTAEADLLGTEVDGRYRVIELIGEGGMGKVYLAEHIEIGKRVALKVLHPSYSRMPDLVERFRREARAASKIGHPNIVDVTDSGTTVDGSVYFVMEFLEGVELGSVIEREGALDVVRALKIAGQICRALAAAHQQGIVHRDLKPENIFLINRDGAADVVKVLDFGIAKTTEAEAARERRLTSPGMAMGTPEYMAPEQAAGRPADARCDVYALGAIMYEMVTGVPPYSGDNFMEILTKKATIDPPQPLQVRPDLPTQVSDLVAMTMARNPDARPQTMETLEYELNKSLAGRGVAVAQILGMTTDPSVVATLNPGLSMRSMDDGVVVRSPGTPSPGQGVQQRSAGSGLNEMPQSWSGPHMITHTGPHMLAGRTPSDPGRATGPADSLRMPPLQGVSNMSPALGMASMPGPDPAVSAQVPQLKRGASSILGWLLLATVLFGGVGTLLYFALSERGDRSNAVSLRDADQPPHHPKRGEPPPPPPVVPQKPQAASQQPQQAAQPGSDDKADKAQSKKVQQQPPQKGRTVDKRPTPPPPPAGGSDDPKAMIREGKALEKAGNFEQARLLYQKLERVKGWGEEAVYKQAWAVFQAGDNDGAITLSRKVAEMNGARRNDALFLYGDALYRNGEFQRAKNIYSSLRKSTTGSLTVTATKKLVACNKALKLPESDGIDNN